MMKVEGVDNLNLLVRPVLYKEYFQLPTFLFFHFYVVSPQPLITLQVGENRKCYR